MKLESKWMVVDCANNDGYTFSSCKNDGRSHGLAKIAFGVCRRGRQQDGGTCTGKVDGRFQWLSRENSECDNPAIMPLNIAAVSTTSSLFECYGSRLRGDEKKPHAFLHGVLLL